MKRPFRNTVAVTLVLLGLGSISVGAEDVTLPPSEAETFWEEMNPIEEIAAGEETTVSEKESVPEDETAPEEVETDFETSHLSSEDGEGTEANLSDTSEASETDENVSDEAEDWESYLRQKLLPMAVLGLSSVLSVYVTVSPALHRIKKRAESFGKAALDIRSVMQCSEESRQKLARSEQELATVLSEVRDELAACHKELETVRHMLRIGFANQEELVGKGAAEEIFALDSAQTDREAGKRHETSKT